jgi:norsolorinic acid ketoreductase
VSSTPSPTIKPDLVYRSKSLTPSRNYIPLQNALYAPTKLVWHWYTRAIAAEDEWLTAFPIDPG